MQKKLGHVRNTRKPLQVQATKNAQFRRIAFDFEASNRLADLPCLWMRLSPPSDSAALPHISIQRGLKRAETKF